MPFIVIEVPFHMGLEEVGVGRGPARFLRAGADRVLADSSSPAQVVHLRLRDATASGLDAVVDLNRGLRAAAREALDSGACPVVLAGNCNSCLGPIAAIQTRHPAARVGIVWLDAHADFNTPATSLSGALDGMALAAAVGHCHDDLRDRIGMSGPVPEENVVLLGYRDLDPEERTRLTASGIAARPAVDLADAAALLARLRKLVDAVYLHIDVDFLDPTESPGVNFRGQGGVPVAKAVELVTEIARSVPLAAVALANHNPEHDPSALTPAAALRLLGSLK